MDTIEDSNEPPGSGDTTHPPHKWNDWKWQLKNRITNVQGITRACGISIPDAVVSKFPISITPYYWSLIRQFDYSDPIFRMCVPSAEEMDDTMFSDPLHEEEQSPVECLVHRYNDRALLISTSVCSVYCRYCTRKRTVGMKDEAITGEQLDKAVEYLKKHPEVEDVIISGGDPLVMSNAWLRWILTAIRAIPSVQVIRIGTKVPVVLPQRINESLVKLLSEFHPLYINTHFNHPNEVTPESQRACEMLVNHGIPVGNQSVLLRGVNDNPQVYEELCRKLIRMRVRPYYLYQCDLVKGVEHFRTPIATGLGVMYYLRGRLSGIGIPQFIIDSPGGKGKIPILPDYVVERTDEKIVLRNHLGEQVEYPEPKHSEDGL